MLLEKVKSDAKADNPYLFFRGDVFHKCFYEMSLCRRCEEVLGGHPGRRPAFVRTVIRGMGRGVKEAYSILTCFQKTLEGPYPGS